MRYENLPCDGCSLPLLQGEDIVTCPDCGTPQHRDCWLAQGCCCNAHKHTQGFVWAAPSQEEPEPAETRQCAVCAGVNAPEDAVCRHCGNPLQVKEGSFAAGAAPLFGGGLPPSDPYLYGMHVPPDAELEGVKLRDIVAYVQTSAGRYLNKFHRKTPLSWNWAAVFFQFYWMLYRKMYWLAAVCMVLNIAVSAIHAPEMTVVMEEMVRVSEQWQSKDLTLEQQLALSEQMARLMPKTYPLLAEKLGLTIFFALLSDWVYRRKVLREIRQLRNTQPEEKSVLAALTRRGGTSMFAVMAGIGASRGLGWLAMLLIERFLP